MSKKIISLLLFFLANLTFSQDLYVADNSYVYARDVVVFVNDDIRLETPTSNLYFRGDAQLLQNTDTKNSDAGELSIYQNQTTNIYEYNFWCSPVGVSADGITQANVDFDGSNIHDPQDDTDLTNVNSNAYSFTPAYNGTATELSSEWMYSLQDGEGYYSWNQIYNTTALGTGYGFTLKGSPNTNNVLDFRGRPNNGTITVSCAFDGVDNQPASGVPNTAETLTGNPYPSALDLKLFFVNSVSNQTNLSGEIYFWEQKQKSSHYLADYEGGYGVYTPGALGNLADNGTYTVAPFEDYNGDGSTNGATTGNTTDFSVNNSRRYAAVGQGFIIQSFGLGGNATFDNSMRVYLPEDSTPAGNGSVFSKNGNSKTTKEIEYKKVTIMSHNGVDYKTIIENPAIVPEIRLHTQINNTFYKENVIAFRASTPDNNTYNRFYDGRSINELSSDAYLISSGEPLAIKSIDYDETTRIPFGLKAGNDNMVFRVNIHKLNSVPNNVNIYVSDNKNNTYTDIKNGSYEVTLDEGIYNDRFEITFAKSALNVVDNTFTNFKIFQNNNAAQLKLANPNRLSLKNISVFDVSGKRVIIETINSENRKYSYSTKSYADGIYIVKVETSNNKVITKKVVVTNKNN
ncbi:T9SS type A sorting domain-containing protein [Sabulilitoribacter multivorans]|uniref:T9SS type A sorting domain-containing protein n=1 Tax=Flaviramulus multivorans TaxID=1304750 RepID=A0ABS9IJX8_9FLAO|nr:T9SS type A sorting domain-containing protein [Flaviramulus multivorans]MCF7560895.1 T9SS type A sorting domain-containing protein [Flaviramulus multivorans]